MSTLTEILLIIVVTTLTITLTIIGVQLFLILKDIRERICKVDPILDNLVVEQEYLNEILVTAKETTNKISETTNYINDEVIQPIGNVVSAVKGVSDLVSQFTGRPNRRKRYLEEDNEDNTERSAQDEI